jgi:hypothetical protein
MNGGNYSGEYDALVKIESERRGSKRFEMRKPGAGMEMLNERRAQSRRIKPDREHREN